METVDRLPPADLEGYTDGSVFDPRKMLQGGGGYTLLDARRPEARRHPPSPRLCFAAAVRGHATQTVRRQVAERVVPGRLGLQPNVPRRGSTASNLRPSGSHR